MLLNTIVAMAALIGYEGQDACFDYEHVLAYAPQVLEAREGIELQFSQRIQSLELLISERQIIETRNPSPEQGQLAQLDERIDNERQQIETDLNNALYIQRGHLETQVQRELSELQRILKIGNLKQSCFNYPLLHDVTDAVLAHLRGLPVVWNIKTVQEKPPNLALKSKPATLRAAGAI